MADRSTSAVELIRQALPPRYQIEAELGRGGTAIGYRALDRHHGRTVAIKVLDPNSATSGAGERLLRQIGLAAQLQHPHIVPVLDVGRATDLIYLVMPLIEGETLRARLERNPALSVNEIVRILLDVADALSFAHERGIVHRDIKPENIILSGRHAMVTDFGVAMAGPEINHRTDLVALGGLGYEMLAGRPPFVGSTLQDAPVVLEPETLRSRRPDVPVEVVRAIEGCLAKSPDDRWNSADQFVEALDGLIATSGAAAMPGPRPWLRPLGAATAIFVLGLAAWRLSSGRSAEVPPPARPERISFLGTVREAALSPDGTTLAYVTATVDGQQLWVQDARGAGPAIQVRASARIVGATWVDGGAKISFAEGPADAPTTRVVSRLGGAARLVGHGRGIVSPSGDLVVIAAGGDPGLLVLRPGTGDSIRLRRPADGWLSGIAWSPGSDRFVLSIVAGDRSGSALWLLDLKGLATRVATEAGAVSGPTWAPDGRAVYYLAGHEGVGKDLIRVNLDGTRRTLIAANLPVPDDSRRHPTGTFVSVSADGRRIVFVEEEAWSNLGRIRLGGNGAQPKPELFTMGTALYSAPRLSPDGRLIAVFVSTPGGSALGTVPAGGNALTELVTVSRGGSVAWSPEGTALAYTAENADSGRRLMTLDLRTGARARQPGQVGLELDWGHQGIIVQRPGNHGLLRRRADSAGPGDFGAAETATTVYGPRSSPDGKSVAVLAYQGGTGPVTLSLIRSGDSAMRGLLAGAYRPVGWSADGQLVYAAKNTFAPTPEALMAVPVGGGSPRVVARLPAGFRSEDITSDGRLLVVTEVKSRSDTWQIDLPPPR